MYDTFIAPRIIVILEAYYFVIYYYVCFYDTTIWTISDLTVNKKKTANIVYWELFVGQLLIKNFITIKKKK